MAAARRPGGARIDRRHRLGLLLRVEGRVLTFESRQIFPNRAASPLLVGPVDHRPLDALETTGVRLDHAGVHGKALATHQARFHGVADDLLEDRAQDVALPEAAVAIDREGRMIGNPVFQAKPAEPSIDQVRFDLLAQTALGADRVAVADDQHPDHQLRTDRRSARMAVIRRKLAAQPTEVQNRVDLAQQMIGWHHVFETELVKKPILTPQLLTHHRPALPRITRTTESRRNQAIKRVFQHSWLKADLQLGCDLRLLHPQ